MLLITTQGLTQVEEMLISPILPIMTLYRLPHGQYGYSGHVINLPQDVASFANTLPREPHELDVIIVRKEGATSSHCDFHVRKSVVLHALQWLITNNIYYRNVTINFDVLNLLPNNGDLCGLTTMTVNSEEEEQPGTDDVDPYNAHLGSTFVPMPVRGRTEQQTIRQTIQQPPCAPPTVSWPSTCATPVNEFNTEGYISCAFPTLFPTGAADFLSPRLSTVTVGNYFKHFLLYHDGRFAKHPRFRYFALNTVMRHRALQTGKIYVRQHPHDAHLTVDDLRDMVGREGEALSNRVLHFASSLRGTRQYWFKQRSQLIALVDTLGLPTVFFTHSAADLQWPELSRLICPDDSQSSTSRSQALMQNPAIADWFFYHRIDAFLDAFYKGVLGASDFWLRFEWQHRGSPHVHGLAWLRDSPNVEDLFSEADSVNTVTHMGTTTSEANDHVADGCIMDYHAGTVGDATESETSGGTIPTAAQINFLEYVDKTVTTINPAVLPNGSNVADAPLPKTNPHICNKPYSEVVDFNEDLSDLIATCQRHTRCSAAYCLRTRNGVQQCRFGYPKPLQPRTVLLTGDKNDETDGHDTEPVLITARNDGYLNSFNPVQLSAWRANVDMQYCVSRRKVIDYITKYATKSEPRSLPLREVYTKIVRSLKDNSTSLKAVQKLLINSVGERDYSAQETCHLLLQLPLIRSSRDVIILSLDGSRQVDDQLGNNSRATVASILDNYIQRPNTPIFEEMKLLHFAQNYSMPKVINSEPKRHKMKVVIVRPYCSPDPNGSKYEQYCQQQLMLHKPFRHIDELKHRSDTFAAAYALFLQSGNIPPSLEDDIRRLEQQQSQHMVENEEDNEEVNNIHLHVKYIC